jgi:hypothetical protein
VKMQDQILKERFESSSMSGSCNFVDIVTEFRPFERWIGHRNDNSSSSCSLSGSINGGSYWTDELGAGGANSEEEDDVIEDC